MDREGPCRTFCIVRMFAPWLWRGWQRVDNRGWRCRCAKTDSRRADAIITTALPSQADAQAEAEAEAEAGALTVGLKPFIVPFARANLARRPFLHTPLTTFPCLSSLAACLLFFIITYCHHCWCCCCAACNHATSLFLTECPLIITSSPRYTPALGILPATCNIRHAPLQRLVCSRLGSCSFAAQSAPALERPRPLSFRIEEQRPNFPVKDHPPPLGLCPSVSKTCGLAWSTAAVPVQALLSVPGIGT